MKRRRLELPRHNCHYPLKVARLPIPPPLQHVKILNKMCPEQDSNLHVVKHTHLKRARLPIPPPGLLWLAPCQLIQKMSGKRDSNPRPRPWQGRALPTELLPRSYSIKGSISLNACAKVLILFKHPNFLYSFFQKQWRIAILFLYHI